MTPAAGGKLLLHAQFYVWLAVPFLCCLQRAIDFLVVIMTAKYYSTGICSASVGVLYIHVSDSTITNLSR